ncbi:MAG: hypothetical protein R3B47_05415 [Bacteroidia bacterium]
MKNLRFALLVFGILNACFGQDVIESRRFKDYSMEDGPYPMVMFDYERATWAATHQVAARISDKEFVYLYEPRFSNFRERKIRRFDLNLKVVWESEFRLDREELIFHFFVAGDRIQVLSSQYHFRASAWEIHHRSFSTENGELLSESSLMVISGGPRQPVGYSYSPDSSKILLYYLDGKTRDNGRYTFNSGLPGLRVNRADGLIFHIYDNQMNLVDSSQMALELERRDGAQFLDATLDDAGNVYATMYEKDNSLRVVGWLREQGRQLELTYNGFPEPWDGQFPYMTYLPLKAGIPGRVHAAHALRERNRGRWETQAFKLVTFDFNEGKVLDEFEAPMNSSLLVEIGKARESINLKPEVVFDRYKIKDLLPMKNGKVWLLAQKHEVSSQNRFSGGQIIGRDYQITEEELLLVGFEKSGKPEGAIIIPLRQRAIRERAAFSMQHRYLVDPETQEVLLLTWEASGDRFRGQERLYHRRINLQEGSVSTRKQIWEGRRRDQYFIAPYMLWLNDETMVGLTIDGETNRYPVLISVKL